MVSKDLKQLCRFIFYKKLCHHKVHISRGSITTYNSRTMEYVKLVLLQCHKFVVPLYCYYPMQEITNCIGMAFNDITSIPNFMKISQVELKWMELSQIWFCFMCCTHLTSSWTCYTVTAACRILYIVIVWWYLMAWCPYQISRKSVHRFKSIKWGVGGSTHTQTLPRSLLTFLLNWSTL
jgi:hypothetical protein